MCSGECNEVANWAEIFIMAIVGGVVSGR